MKPKMGDLPSETTEQRNGSVYSVAGDRKSSSRDSDSVVNHSVDKGWAWVIMIGVFVVNFLTPGYLRSFGILFVEYQQLYGSNSSVTASMNGVQMFCYSIVTFLTMNLLLKYIAVRTACLVGCTLQLISLVCCSLVSNIETLLFTHGVLYGCGQALIYCPAMVLLSEYFDKKRPIATVIASGGVSFGGMAMPFLMRHLVDSNGLRGGLLLLGAVVFQQAVFVSLFAAPPTYKAVELEKTESFNDVYDDILRKDGPTKDSTDKTVEIVCTAYNRDHSRMHGDEIDTCAVSYSSLTESERAIVRSNNNQYQPPLDPISLNNSTQQLRNPNTNIIHCSTRSLQTGASATNHGNIPGDHNLLSSSFGNINKSGNKTKDIVVYVSSITNNHVHSSKDFVQHKDLSHTKLSSLHPLNLQSDPLVRALSTSSIDVLSSAQHLSPPASSITCTRRRRDSNVSTDKVLTKQHHEKGGRTCCRCLSAFRWPEAMSMPCFWMVAIFFGAGGVASVLPVAFLPPLSKSKGLDESDSSLFLVVSSIAEMLGRLGPGLILHFGYMRPTTVVIPSMASCGILLQFVYFFNDFSSMISLSCLLGLFIGAFWAMQVLIVIEVLGMEALGPAFGFYSIVLGCSVGAGFPLAGALVDAPGSFAAAYCFFGAMYLLAALSMFLIQFMKKVTTTDNDLQVVTGEADEQDPLKEQ